MSTEQVNSFVSKFISLWSSGEDVSLQLKSLNGKCKVVMEIDIGNYKAATLHHEKYKGFSPSRQRRRERRLQEAVVQNTVVQNTVVDDQIAEEAVVQATLAKDAENDISTDLTDDLKVQITTENIENTGNDSIDSGDNKTTENTHIEETTSMVEDDTVNSDNSEPVPRTDGSLDTMVKNVGGSSNEVTVYANVNFYRCPRNNLSDNDLKTIDAILLKNDHLRCNIKKVHYGRIFNRRSSVHYLYDHFVEIELIVNTEKLWECARSYVWKHLGKDQWKLDDGTIITLKRIHTKQLYLYTFTIS